jgi:hypothetical protein
MVLTVWISIAAYGCGKRVVSDLSKAEQLATEQGRVDELLDPVAKAKSYIRMSEILLDFAAGAARSQDMRVMGIRLEQYAMAVRAACDNIHSDQNAGRRPQAFKELELAMRGQINRLEDMSRGLPGDQRPPVDAAIDVARSVRDELQHALHPQAG